MIKKILRTILITIIIILLLFFAMVLTFRLSRNADRTDQNTRIEGLQNSTYGPDAVLTIPDQFIDDSIPLNEIRYLATHNSYHHQAGFLQLAVLDLVQPGAAATLRYSHPDFTAQLDLGVRSFEIDIRRYRKEVFENIHVPLVDNRGHSPSVPLVFKELNLWSDRHPAHVPIIVIMQTNDDWRFLDPSMMKWTAAALIEVDRIIAAEFGGKLITPLSIKGNAGSLRDAVLKNGWPKLGDSRGKFIFVYHETDAEFFNAEYLESSERVSFFMAPPDSPEASFILRNDPEAEDIRPLLKQGFIVRTRADADCITAEQQKKAAVASDAQIVSTDYPKGYASNGSYSLSWNELLSRYKD